MNRILLAGALSLALISSALAEPLDRYLVDQPQLLRTGGPETEVEVLFWYGCTYCHVLEEGVEDWSKSKPDIEIFHVPAVLDESWEAHAKLYYIAESLDLLHRTHEEAYWEVRSDVNSLNSPGEIAEFLNRGRSSEAEIKMLFWSPSINKAVAFDKARIRGYGAMGTPVIVVNGKYMLYPNVNGPEAFIQELEELLTLIASNE